MKLQQLFSFFDIKLSTTKTDANLFELELSGLFFDARKVIPNGVFVAIKGTKHDGHDFIPEAVSAGAIGLVVENKSKVPENYFGAVLIVEDTRQALDHIAAIFNDFPSKDLFCFGVTGTNGKTSITYILEHILRFNHKTMAVMGTVNNRVDDLVWPSEMTTPDPVTLQKRLREFIDHQAVAVAMEVSSHALDQQRVESVSFNTAIFTNLTLDHLDYHKTMEHYFASKQKLFTDLLWASTKKPVFAIVNTDDSYGRKLQVADHAVTWTYGQKECDFQFKILKMNYSETKFELKTSMETLEMTVPLSGVHMIYNVVASCIGALTCGISLEHSARALKTFYGVPGRLQKVIVDSNSPKTVFVDYAHTPDALENVLKSLVEVRHRLNSKSKIHTVFGCGGDRDKSKRPLMGQLAAKYSDFIYVTSDNPRTEPPETIIEEIKKGIPTDYTEFKIQSDREKAIAEAIRSAHPDDVVLIAGKGHEDYQIIGTEKFYFSDIEVAQKYL